MNSNLLRTITPNEIDTYHRDGVLLLKNMFDKEWYDTLRLKYHAIYLPTMHDKVTVDKIEERKLTKESWERWILGLWPVGGTYAIWKAIQSKDYLLHREKKID